MTKIVQIGDQRFELVQWAEGDVEDVTYTLKPIEPEEEVRPYNLCINELKADSSCKKYDLTPSEAEAVAKCLEAVMEYITNHKDWGIASANAFTARELIQKRKGK